MSGAYRQAIVRCGVLLAVVLILQAHVTAEFAADTAAANRPLPPKAARFDRNGDNKLQADELPIGQRDRMIRQLDKDGDGALDLTELKPFFQRMRSENQDDSPSIPQPGPSEQVREIKDIAYAAGVEYPDKWGMIDLYLPRGRDHFPVLFFIHGGGLTGGDKSKLTGVGRRFAKEGFGVVTVNYRLPSIGYTGTSVSMAATESGCSFPADRRAAI